MSASAQFAASSKPQKPVIHIDYRTRRPAIDAQLDLERMLAAAVIEQNRFLVDVRPALVQAAVNAFISRQPRHIEYGFLHVHASVAIHAWRIQRLFAAARILGRAQIRKQAKLPARSKFEIRNVKFDEVLGNIAPQRAIEYLSALPVATREEWNAAVDAAQQSAFTVSGIQQKLVLVALKDLIVQSLQDGLTAQQFDDAAQELLRGFGISATRMRTVWNTTVGNALAAGRMEELKQPDVMEVLPFWLFDSMHDMRVRWNHGLLDGHIAPADWPGWDDYAPLLGFNCRCVLIGITGTAARAIVAADDGMNLENGVPWGAGKDPGYD